jgi:4-hydroxy-tetrahydrodipicolinate reductase
MTARLRIGVTGCKGRMGRMLVQAVAESERAMLAGGTVRPGDAWDGRDLGEATGLGRADAPVLGDPLDLFARADAVIDFTTPELTVKHAELAANMSLGVNLLLGLVQQVAATLGPEYDIEISEMHHRHKKDAPSGTALALGRAAADGRKVVLDQVADRGRDGLTGARETGHIGFAALRGGDVAGEHSVIFAGPGERVELSHKASSRAVFGQDVLGLA